MKTNHTKDKTPTPDAKTVATAKELAHEIHSTFAAAYAIEVTVNHEWLENKITQALTDLQANVVRNVLIDLLGYTLSDRNMSDELRVAKLKSFIQVRLPDYKNYLE